jgi:hypothetical protein
MINNLQALIGNQAYDDLCEKFAEEAVYGHSNMYANAITAWMQQANHGVIGPSLSGIQPGDLVYFSPNEGNGYNGHAGIYQGNGQFLSATDNGVQLNDIGRWAKSTGQQILGYVPTSNPKLKAQLSTLQGGNANQQSTLTDANAPSTQHNQLLDQQQLQGAQQAASWFQNYQQQTQQQEMSQMPHQASPYTPASLSMAATPTASEQWLRQYTG